MTTFLPLAYRYKEIGDYSVDPDVVITMPQAQSAVASATEFLAGVRATII